VRERIPELAVLKTIGFTDTAVLSLVLLEALLMCMLGGTLGMLLAVAAMKGLALVQTQFPPFHADLRVWLFAVASMLALAAMAGLPPALRAKRLSIVDALAGR
jgi:putative ABC transport system permease protein